MTSRFFRLTKHWPFLALDVLIALVTAFALFTFIASSTAKSEAQTVADGAALAGAAALLSSPDDPTVARKAAIAFARRNRVAGRPVVLTSDDIGVDVNEGRVEVEVRGDIWPISVPGIRTHVVARAAAEALAASPNRAMFKRLRLVE